MPRPKKEGKTLNIKLDAILYEKLEKYCEESRRTKTATIEMVLEEFLKEKKID